jgi:hypothetical protein
LECASAATFAALGDLGRDSPKRRKSAWRAPRSDRRKSDDNQGNAGGLIAELVKSQAQK